MSHTLTDAVAKLTINDAPIVQLVTLLQECNLFDDNGRNQELEITLADLQNLLRAGVDVGTVQKCMVRMGEEEKFFPTFGAFLAQLRATKKKLEEEEATLEQIGNLDPHFPQVIELLTKGSFFRDCAVGSIELSATDLSRLVKIARGGQSLLNILESLDQDQAHVTSMDGLKILVKARRSKSKASAPPTQVMSIPSEFKHAQTGQVLELEGEEGDVAVPRFTRVSVEAGGTFMETLTISPGPPSEFGTHVSWHFKECYGYDISFSVTCNGAVVRAPSRCSSDKGSYETPPNLACELSFVWDNSFSWINGKEIEWFFFIFSAKEAEQQRTEQANSKAERESLQQFNIAFDQLALELKQIKADWGQRRAKADQVLLEAQQKHSSELQQLANELALTDHHLHKQRLAELYALLDKLENTGSTRCETLREQVSNLVTNFREADV